MCAGGWVGGWWEGGQPATPLHSLCFAQVPHLHVIPFTACPPRSAELATADNCDLHLTVALSYSGRQDLTLAVQEIARLAAAGHLAPAEVTPQLIAAHLATRQLPPSWQQPDLVVRTSGEQRLSNFMCWEAAYSGGWVGGWGGGWGGWVAGLGGVEVPGAWCCRGLQGSGAAQPPCSSRALLLAGLAAWQPKSAPQPLLCPLCPLCLQSCTLVTRCGPSSGSASWQMRCKTTPAETAASAAGWTAAAAVAAISQQVSSSSND